MNNSDYLLVTPARNEEGHIGATVESVLSQSILPRKWVIVSDGSVDRTDEIVARYSLQHSFIQLLRAGEQGIPEKKDFGSKVLAFRAGYERLEGIPRDFIGNIDADVTFRPQYFEQILQRFEADSTLGVAGGIVLEPHRGELIPQATSLNSVCGSVQLFRAKCYEEIGGYIPIRMGGVDAAAEIMARMHGWKVQTFPDIPVIATREVRTGGATIFHTKYRQGMSNYILGYHPLFQLASSVSRMGDRPIVGGGLALLFGYISSWLKGNKRALPADAVQYLRAEQIQRLLEQFSGWKRRPREL